MDARHLRPGKDRLHHRRGDQQAENKAGNGKARAAAVRRHGADDARRRNDDADKTQRGGQCQAAHGNAEMNELGAIADDADRQHDKRRNRDPQTPFRQTRWLPAHDFVPLKISGGPSWTRPSCRRSYSAAVAVGSL